MEGARKRLPETPPLPRCRAAVFCCVCCGACQVESATCLTNMTTLEAWEWGSSCLDDFIVIALLRTNSEKTKLLCTKVRLV